MLLLFMQGKKKEIVFLALKQSVTFYATQMACIIVLECSVIRSNWFSLRYKYK
jgi:hypothetical protein